MSTSDTCCTVAPYFQVDAGNLAEFRAVCASLVERASQEDLCLYYGFSFHGDQAFCREGYLNAAGVLAHLQNTRDLLDRLLSLSQLVRLEIHGPAAELEQLREPLAALNPQFFVLEYGFRRES